MNTNLELVISGAAPGTTFDTIKQFAVDKSAESVAARNAMLESARDIEQVVDAVSLQFAMVTLKELRDTMKAIEEKRKQIKSPILEFGKRIDTVASEFSAPIAVESVRIGRMVDDYATKQAQIAQQEERQRQAEMQRLERERQAAMVKEQTATTSAEVAKAQEDAARLKAQQKAVVVAPPAAVKVAGTVMVWQFDVDAAALYKARPDLCNAPTPRLLEIRAALNALKEGETIPGILNAVKVASVR